ncbi:MAG: AAA family ATPase [Rhodospirillaceae bacterium]|jgi:chromosome partitioning protein|nr:AAA family ATPase [Rhodospirillaceae bacterium]
MSSRIISITNQKGGVGKTTTAINLATAIVSTGKCVLIVDLDPQGNASTGLGVERKSCDANLYHVLTGDANLSDGVISTQIPNLSIIPSSIDLSGAEIELIDKSRREYLLYEALINNNKYDYIFIDCPPSLSLLTLNALVASQAVLVPLQCEFFALEGVSHLIKIIDRVNEVFNPKLKLHGIVLTMFDKRNCLSNMVATDVRNYFGDKVYKTMIPRNVRVSEAPSHGKPVLLYDVRCAGSEAYVKLAIEVLKRERDLWC